MRSYRFCAREDVKNNMRLASKWKYFAGVAGGGCGLLHSYTLALLETRLSYAKYSGSLEMKIEEVRGDVSRASLGVFQRYHRLRLW